MNSKSEIKKSLNSKELQQYNIMEQLPNTLNHLLQQIIKNANKNQIFIFRKNKYKKEIVELIQEEIKELIKKELVAINTSYHPYGNEISLIVLPKAPTLVNKLK